MLLQELDIFPAVTRARKYSASPLGGCLMHIVLNLDTVRLPEVLTVHRIRETDRYAYLVGAQEWIVTIIHIRWTPAEDVCVQSHEQSGESGLLRASEHRDCDIVFLTRWPI